VTLVGGWLGLVLQPFVGAVIDITRQGGVDRSGLVRFGGRSDGDLSCTVILDRNDRERRNCGCRRCLWPGRRGDYARPLPAEPIGSPDGPQRRLRHHAGNVAIAAAAGAVGWAISQRAVFMLVPIFAVLAAVAVLSIPAAAIDHDRARGGEPTDDKEHTPAGLSVLLTCRLLLVYAGCAMLFHFANAPLLPLVGQKLALAHPAWGTAMMSSCIIAAQIIMLPIAFLVGHTADTWGRKPILLIGFGILPLRAALYTFYERRHVADRSATAGGGWGGDFRRDHAPRPGRSDAWHRTLQCGSGSRRDGAGYWRVGKRIGRRVDC